MRESYPAFARNGCHPSPAPPSRLGTVRNEIPGSRTKEEGSSTGYFPSGFSRAGSCAGVLAIVAVDPVERDRVVQQLVQALQLGLEQFFQQRNELFRDVCPVAGIALRRDV